MSYYDSNKVISSLLIFIEFCLVSSCVYIINDIVDIDKDREHPKKRFRPIASGEVSVNNAIIVAAILMGVAVALAFISKNINSFLVICLYFGLNIAYSLYLKKMALVDVFVISLGFLMRIYAGAFAIDVKVSSWLLLTALSLSLFLAFGKRYGEKKKIDDKTTRDVLADYDIKTLKGYISICMTLTIVFYSLYCAIGSGVLGENSVITVPIVMFAMFRYFMNLDKEVNDGDPTDVVLKDRVIQACVLLYVLIVVILIWR